MYISHVTNCINFVTVPIYTFNVFFRRKKIYMLDTKFHPTCTLVWIWHFIIVSSIDDDDYVLYYGYDLWVRYKCCM